MYCSFQRVNRSLLPIISGSDGLVRLTSKRRLPRRVLLHTSIAKSCGAATQTEHRLMGGKYRRKWEKEPPPSSLGIYHAPFSMRQFSTDDNKNDPDKLKEQDKNDDKHKHDGSQFWSHWIRELQSPPNVITTVRLLSTPIFSYWIITGNHKLAVAGCIVAAASDYLDGYLAKQHGMSTVLGAYLDPFADKVFINVLAGSLWYTGILPAPLVGLWLARDVALVIGGASYVRSQSQNNAHAYDPTVTPFTVTPTLLSKANTVFQFTTVGLGIVYPLGAVPTELLTGMCYLTGMTTIGSGLQYLDLSAFAEANKENTEDTATTTSSSDKKSSSSDTKSDVENGKR